MPAAPATATDPDVLVQRLYDRIVDTLVQGGDGNKSAYDPNRTYFTLEPRGRIIDPQDFAGAWTPSNPNGSHTAAMMIAELADEAPIFTARHTPGAAKITQLYQQVLRATVTKTSPPNPAVDAAYKKANDFLYSQTPNPDVAGQFILSESPAYQAYKTNQTSYANAVSAYRMAYSAALADPKLKATWPLVGPSLLVPVHQAWHTWRSAQADQVEGALATLETSGKDQVKRAFADAALLFDSYKMTFDEGLGHVRSSLLPSNWYMPGVSNGWPTVNFDSATATSSQSSDYTSYSASAGLNLGLWSVGGGVSGSSQHFASSASSKDTHISYQYALITIRRPWLNGLLFGLPGWRTDIAPKGTLSSGSRANQGKTTFPLMPQAFFAIKNLRITAGFSSSEVQRANSEISARASVGWGPFSISGSYKHGSSSQYMKGTVSSAGIVVPFVQIIGWVNTILPFCPPE